MRDEDETREGRRDKLISGLLSMLEEAQCDLFQSQQEARDWRAKHISLHGAYISAQKHIAELREQLKTNAPPVSE